MIPHRIVFPNGQEGVQHVRLKLGTVKHLQCTGTIVSPPTLPQVLAGQPDNRGIEPEAHRRLSWTMPVAPITSPCISADTRVAPGPQSNTHSDNLPASTDVGCSALRREKSVTSTSGTGGSRMGQLRNISMLQALTMTLMTRVMISHDIHHDAAKITHDARTIISPFQ